MRGGSDKAAGLHALNVASSVRSVTGSTACSTMGMSRELSRLQTDRHGGAYNEPISQAGEKMETTAALKSFVEGGCRNIEVYNLQVRLQQAAVLAGEALQVKLRTTGRADVVAKALSEGVNGPEPRCIG